MIASWRGSGIGRRKPRVAMGQTWFIVLVMALASMVAGGALLAQETPSAQETETSPDVVAVEETTADAVETPTVEVDLAPAEDVAPAEDTTPAEVAAPAEGEAPVVEPWEAPAFETPVATSEPGDQDSTLPAAVSQPVDDTPNGTPGGGLAVEALSPEQTPPIPAETTEADETQTPATQTDANADTIDPWKVFVLVVTLLALAIVPFFLAQWICKTWRAPEYTFRIWATLFCLLTAAVLTSTLPTTLGIDLKGGVILIYEVVAVAPTDGEDGQRAPSDSADDEDVRVDMDAMTAAIKRRVDPSGVREISVQKLGRNELKVIVPEADAREVDRIRAAISDAGTLQFRILADYQRHADLIRLAMERPDETTVYQGGKPVAWWFGLDESGKAEFSENSGGIVSRVVQGERQVLVVNDGYDVTGKYLVHSRAGNDPKTADPCVFFTFNTRGGQLFSELTTEYGPEKATGKKYRLGIILSDMLVSWPSINEPIGQSGQITGRFTQQRVDDIVAVLNAGRLPADLSRTPVSEFHTGPTLGADTIAAGKWAIGTSAVVVLLFMAVYYRFAGLIACFAVIMNLLMLVGTMKLLQAAFTLPGLAGVVLTVGMAVDANVLIFERIREELDRRSTIRMAIRNGFQKAWTTIFDANITTLITAVILYWVGSEQIKGFAVTLFLGIVFSMFTAIYCSRAIFEIAERTGRLKSLDMMRLIGRTDWDFLGKRHICGVISGVLIALGLVGVFFRGEGLLDIDFVGGVSIETLFNEPQDIGAIRSNLSDLRDLQVLSVDQRATAADASTIRGLTHTRFIINTATPPGMDVEEYRRQVETLMEEKFGAALEHYAMSVDIVGSTRNAEGAMVTEATLVFPQRINYKSLDSLIGNEIKELNQRGILSEAAPYKLSNPEYGGPRDNVPYETWNLTIQVPEETARQALGDIQDGITARPYFPSSSKIGSSVARDTQLRAAAALSLALISIIAYIWFRFNGVVFGVAAVVALIHDVLIALGLLALSKWVATPLAFLQVTEFKIGLPVLAAFLTLIGYSLNDTIIVFDRMREVRGKSPDLTYGMMNASVNQTLSRTLLTSLTTFIVVVILYFLGGPGIHTFAFTMLVGIIVGTYSSIYVAAPVLHWLFQLTRE